MTVFVDTNIFVLALLDPDEPGQKAAEVLNKIAKDKLKAVTSVLVLDEVMWILIKNKRSERVEAAVQNIYELPNLVVYGIPPETPMRALRFMKQYKLKPRDAMHCAFMEIEGINTIVSDDSDFDSVKEIKRLSL